MKSGKLIKSLLSAVLLVGALSHAQAEDKATDPSGTYFWTVPTPNGGERTNTLVLKVDGGKLTGTVSIPGRNGKVKDTDITDGKVIGSDISFSVITTTRNGKSMTNAYTGTLTDGTIKGKRNYVNRNGDEKSSDWEAKQQK